MRLAPKSPALLILLAGACGNRDHPSPPADAAVEAVPAPPAADAAPEPPPSATGPAAPARPLHFDSAEDLLALIEMSRAPKKKRDRDPMPFLKKAIGPGTPSKANQGNPALAQHAIAREACLEGLRGVTIQTEEQRSACGGRENMVPIFERGDPKRTRTCIDVFEFPNRACELPFVWMPPTWARAACDALGKRLCTQEEWVLACSGDPAGGKRQRHAYGEDLDLAACNTSKSSRASGCDATSARSAWNTCATGTEPSGSFPRCRSRFGVFDQHGNVAEAMTRLDADGEVYSQLKGSAFFYVDVARKPGDEARKENYPDHCGHDPRWHVEPIGDAWHVNYHLGFRCCATP